MHRNKLYLALFGGCLLGYIWIYYNLYFKSIRVCLFKHLTSIPCPSCGSSRAVLSLLEGYIIESLYINPIGIVIAMIMVISPIWVIYDLIYKRSTLFDFYKKIELLLKRKIIAIPLVILIITNWIWNIYKNL